MQKATTTTTTTTTTSTLAVCDLHSLLGIRKKRQVTETISISVLLGHIGHIK
ncbi:MAG TPA: hypothetical protein GX497_04060 [Bacillus bacterium]|nr:hypothetical protein [Bacillus sp. (in: firmicutes)]